MLRALLFACFAAVPLSAGAQTPSMPPDHFEKKIRPLLNENCVRCHGPLKAQAGLRLDSAAGLKAGTDSGPIIATDKPLESRLMHAVGYGGKIKMPPPGKLSAAQLADLQLWAMGGFVWPEVRSVEVGAGTKTLWSVKPLAVVPLPVVKNAGWVRKNPDRFILEALEARHLTPAPAADKPTWLRRVTFDLTGLPPTIADIDAFLADATPEATAKVVDRLLASRSYGVRWGRHWLDLVRYCDSFDARGTGGEMDCADAWRYRDWVVQSFAEDLPYDRFVRMQIAGDVLDECKDRRSDGIVATGMLALGNWGGGDADKEKLLTDIVDDQVDVVTRSIMGLTVACARCHDHKFDPIATKDYYAMAGIFFSSHILPNVGPKTNGPPMMRIPLPETPARLTLIAAIRAITGLKTEPIPLVPLMANGAQEGGVPGSPQAGLHDVKVHRRGRYDMLGDAVPRGFPKLVSVADTPKIVGGSGRVELAQWLTRPDHPLTARVIANRVWQFHFGQGLVRTPSNFGTLGETPSHPALLDYLAGKLIESKWSLKSLHREIVLSATYAQSSAVSAPSLAGDVDNRLLSRYPRRRLESEAIRDSLLSVAGRLNLADDSGPATRDFDSPRRSLYQMTIRSDRTGFGPLFDVADSTSPVDQRIVSTVAPQALFLMNHPFVKSAAKGFADRVRALPGSTDDRLTLAHRLALGRVPTGRELVLGRGVVAEGNWESWCHLLMQANEFISVE